MEDTRFFSSLVGAAVKTQLWTQILFEHPRFCRASTQCHSCQITPLDFTRMGTFYQGISGCS